MSGAVYRLIPLFLPGLHSLSVVLQPLLHNGLHLLVACDHMESFDLHCCCLTEETVLVLYIKDSSTTTLESRCRAMHYCCQIRCDPFLVRTFPGMND